jgi:hypothetical protein
MSLQIVANHCNCKYMNTSYLLSPSFGLRISLASESLICQSWHSMEIKRLLALRSAARHSRKLTKSEQLIADERFSEYCSRPQHASRMTCQLRAMLRAAANCVARHGNPPNRQARLAYRMHRKRRERLAMLALYGDPARDVPQPNSEPPRKQNS